LSGGIKQYVQNHSGNKVVFVLGYHGWGNVGSIHILEIATRTTEESMGRCSSSRISFFLFIGIFLVVNGCAKLGPEDIKTAEIPSGKSQEVQETSLNEGQQQSIYSLETLEKIKPKVARLYVDTNPPGARVRIMNIKPKFLQGMKLNPGKYKIETTSPGYIKDLRWIEITEKKDFRLSVTLKKQ
jgi:hypothetical protein